MFENILINGTVSKKNTSSNWQINWLSYSDDQNIIFPKNRTICMYFGKRERKKNPSHFDRLISHRLVYFSRYHGSFQLPLYALLRFFFLSLSLLILLRRLHYRVHMEYRSFQRLFVLMNAKARLVRCIVQCSFPTSFFFVFFISVLLFICERFWRVHH